MDKVKFWKLIDASRRAAEGDPEEQMDVPSEPSGEEWKEEDLDTLYPKLSRMLGD